MPAGAPAVPPPITTTSYSPSTGSAARADGTVGSPRRKGRGPFSDSLTSPAAAASPVAPLSDTPAGCGKARASAAAAVPTRSPAVISASGRSSRSAASRGMSAHPPSTYSRGTPAGRKQPRSIFAAPGHAPASGAAAFTGSGGI